MSTDGASVYTGDKSGMIKRLKEKENFNKKIIYLPDFCHKTERLMKSKTPSWMTETINLSSDLVSFVKLHVKIGEKLS